MRLVPKDSDESIFIIDSIERETIRDLCIEALAKDPKNMRFIRVLKGVSPYDKALPPAHRKPIPE